MMETYDRILKWNDESVNCFCDCNSCFFQQEDNSCIKCSELRESLRNETGIHYANADQIKAKIADAEAGNHPWVRGNTLFVCDSSNICGSHPNKACIPHKLKSVNDCCTLCVKPYRGDKSEKVTWPGRTDEDCSDVEETVGYNRNSDEVFGKELKVYPGKKQDVLKEESVMEYIVEDGCKEYVVIKDLTIESLSENDIVDPVIFLWFYKNFPDMELNEGRPVRGGMGAYEQADELLRLGFIERKVDDPVVVRGDCFKSDELESVYRIVYTGKNDEYVLSNLETGSFCGEVIFDPKRLSDFVGKDRLSEFKPVKIEIREVE